MKLVWNQTMNTGIDKVDQQHRRLVDIVNGIYEAIERGKTIKELGPSFKELVSYTKTHFSDETRLMREIKYEHLLEHEKMHRDLTKQVGDYLGKLESGEMIDSSTLMGFLKDWLVKHILNEDKKFAKVYLAAQQKATVA